MADCAFCAIAAGEMPASIVCEDDTALAFMDLRQPVPGHVLVVPRRHVATLDRLDEETAAHLMRVAVRIAAAMRPALAPDGLSLWQSNGEGAHQEVPHVHLHLQPRRTGDGLLRIYSGDGTPPADASRELLDALAQRLRDGLS